MNHPFVLSESKVKKKNKGGQIAEIIKNNPALKKKFDDWNGFEEVSFINPNNM